MKNLSIRAAKGWNAYSVASMSEEQFLADPAHAIEGLNKEESDAQLKAIYAKCKEAVASDKADLAKEAATSATAPAETTAESAADSKNTKKR